MSYAVPNSTYIPINTLRSIFETDVTTIEKGFNAVLNTYKYAMSQTEYDACIFTRFLCGHLGSEIDSLLKNGIRDRTAWKNAINKLPMSAKRKTDAINLFLDGKYNPDSKDYYWVKDYEK